MSLLEHMKKERHPSLSLKPRYIAPSTILEDKKKGIERDKQKRITDFFKVSKILNYRD